MSVIIMVSTYVEFLFLCDNDDNSEFNVKILQMWKYPHILKIQINIKKECTKYENVFQRVHVL